LRRVTSGGGRSDCDALAAADLVRSHEHADELE
jgi:hypothetical protein